jgi:hypothetical protein
MDGHDFLVCDLASPGEAGGVHIGFRTARGTAHARKIQEQDSLSAPDRATNEQLPLR